MTWFENLNAAEACKTISSRADEIKAISGGATEVVDAIGSILTFGLSRLGKDLRAENEMKTQLRNITNIDLSNEEYIDIRNTCSNTFTGVQINEIDMTQCPYCREYGCPVTNVTQENLIKNEQMCYIQSLVDILLKKTDNIDALATAKVIQDAEGMLSGNKTSMDQCNIVNKDMSSKKYLDFISECANQSAIEQKNRIVGCGPVLNIIQKNRFDNFQKCMIRNTTTQTEETVSETQQKTDVELEQKAEGFTTTGFIISIIISVFILSFISSSISIIIGLGSSIEQK